MMGLVGKPDEEINIGCWPLISNQPSLIIDGGQWAVEVWVLFSRIILFT